MTSSEDYDGLSPEADDDDDNDDDTPPEADENSDDGNGDSDGDGCGDVDMADENASLNSDASSDAGSQAQQRQVRGAARSEADYSDATLFASVAASNDGDRALDPPRHHLPRAHVSHMPGYNEEFLGKGLSLIHI